MVIVLKYGPEVKSATNRIDERARLDSVWIYNFRAYMDSHSTTSPDLLSELLKGNSSTAQGRSLALAWPAHRTNVPTKKFTKRQSYTLRASHRKGVA